MPLTVPPLEPHCNSWIVADNGTAVLETWDRSFVERLATNAAEGVTIHTAAQWLAAINQQSKEA